MSRGKILGLAVLITVTALLVPVAWAVVAELRDERPTASDQGGVPGEVLASARRRYLADPRVAAGPEEVAAHRPWGKLRRYRAEVAPFGGRTPALVNELPGASDMTRALDDLLGQGRYEEAAPRVRAGLAAAPDNQALRYQWARVLHSRGELEAAREELYRLGELSPGPAETWIQLAIVLNDIQRQASPLAADRTDEYVRAALTAMDRAEALHGPGDHMVHLQRGIVLCFAGRFEEAEWDLWKAVEAAPMDGNAYWDIAWVEAQRGDGAATVRAMRFAARDPRLFSLRTCQEEVLCDPYFGPVREDPVFLAWVGRLPRQCLAREWVGGAWAAIIDRLSYLIQQCGP